MTADRIKGPARAIAVMAAVLCLCGCMSQYSFPPTEPAGTTSVNWAQNHQIIDVKEGRRIVIYLADERPEYEWVVTQQGKRGILGRIEQTPSPPWTTQTGRAATAFAFMAEGPGVSEVRLEKRATDGRREGIEEFEITVRVEAY